MASVRAIGMLAACVLLAVSGVSAAREATEAEDPAGPSKKKSTDPKDIKVIIPSYSKDVSDNGCRVRANPQEVFSGPDVDIRHVPFAELISETIGRYSVRAILDAPNVFAATLAPLDADTRTLVLIDVLRDGLGRDGLHTFFFMSAAQHAPAIRDALATAGLKREHELLVQAMALFGPDYPVDNDARAKRFSYSSLDTPLNDFDVKMLEVARSFGSRDTLAKAMVAYVERTPALWQRIEGQRARLGETARLRYLNQALLDRLQMWGKPDVEAAPALAALPLEQRTLAALSVFNAEFENGGVHQFFYNSSGVIAPEVHAALLEIGLDRQAAIFKKGLDMLPGTYIRDTEKRRDKFFSHNGWSPWDEKLQKLTDEFYALDGGPTVVRVGDSSAIAGGPDLWSAMTIYAREKKLLPC
jgi:hypothetical protein